MKLFLSILLLNILITIGCQDSGAPNGAKDSVTSTCSQVVSKLATKGKVSTHEVLLEMAELKSKNPTWELDDISNCLDMSYRISCTNKECTY